MTQKIKVSRQFLDDLDLVVKHYKCPQDGIDWLKEHARKYCNLVKNSLSIIANEIKLDEHVNGK